MAVTVPESTLEVKNLIEIFCADQHVRAVLADAEEPVNFIGGGIVAGDEFVEFGGEIEFAVGEKDAVRAAERAEVHAMNFFLRDEINHGERVAGIFGAVIRDDRELAVSGRGDFVRAFAGGNAGDYLFGGGIHDG